MPILRCYVDERTHDILAEISRATGRPISDLAEAAISDAALRAEPPARDAERQSNLKLEG